MTKRQVNANEAEFIRKIADRLPADRKARLLEDLGRATVEMSDVGGVRIVFEIEGYVRPRYRGQHSYGVEGQMLDYDGAKLSIDLFADENDRLLELEIIRWDAEKIIEPKWDTLELY